MNIKSHVTHSIAGFQYLSTAQAQGTDEDSQISQAPHNPHDLEEHNSHDVNDQDRKEKTFGVTIDAVCVSDRDRGMRDMDNDDSNNEFEFPYSYITSSCSDNSVSRRQSDSRLFDDVQEEADDT